MICSSSQSFTGNPQKIPEQPYKLLGFMKRLHKVAHFNFGASLCLTELESLRDGSNGANERAIEILSLLLHFNAAIDPKKSKQRPRLSQDPSFFGSPIIDSIYNYQRYVHRWEERINQSLVRLGPYPPKITFHQVWSISPFLVSRVRHLQRTNRPRNRFSDSKDFT